MTAAAKVTPYEAALQRLKTAAWDLQSAADAANDAVAALDPEETDTGAGRADLALAELVRAMHDTEHDGPIRWCRHDVCVKAEAILATT